MSKDYLTGTIPCLKKNQKTIIKGLLNQGRRVTAGRPFSSFFVGADKGTADIHPRADGQSRPRLGQGRAVLNPVASIYDIYFIQRIMERDGKKI